MVVGRSVQEISQVLTVWWGGVIAATTMSSEESIVHIAQQGGDSSFKKCNEKETAHHLCPKGICNGRKCSPCTHAISDFITQRE